MTTSIFQAKNPENQPLIDALHELAEVETHSNVKNAGFRGRALRVAAQNLAKLDAKITDGYDLADSRSPNKVTGVGQGTAYYINEFLETGKLAEIDEIKTNTEEQTGQESPGLVDSSDGKDDLEEAKDKQEEEKATNDKKKSTTKTKTNTDTTDTDHQIHINRAPVLTLWVTVVAECQGYSREEALTYGKWVSGMLAQAKGQALGIFQKKDKEATEEPKTKRQRIDGKDHVEVFQHIQIPVQDVNGKQLAMEPKATDAIDPDKVQAYLERSFGTEDLQRAEEAMTELANSVSKNKLKDEAYEIYEIIRPEWHGWGKPGSLDLKKISNLEKKAGEEDQT